MTKYQQLTLRAFAQQLEQIIENYDYDEYGDSPLSVAGSLKGEGYLTDDIGLVVDTDHGQRFLITIQEESRR